MKQQSKEWFEARIGRVTGSNVGAILGIDPFRKPQDVMRSMVRDAYGAEREFKGNIATDYGIKNEPLARSEFQMELLLDVKEASFEKHEDWLGASPDGYIDEENALLEIKCPYSMRNEPAPVPFKSIKKQKHYYGQIQVQLFVTGRDRCYFYQWAPMGTKLEVVEKDESWLDENLPVLRNFWEEYKNELENNYQVHLDPLRKNINSAKAKELVEEYDELAQTIEWAKSRMSDIKNDLIDMAGNQNAEICGRKLTKVERPGSVSYAKAIKENMPDLDLTAYRGEPVVSWRLGG